MVEAIAKLHKVAALRPGQVPTMGWQLGDDGAIVEMAGNGVWPITMGKTALFFRSALKFCG
jgi:hypothetical protein